MACDGALIGILGPGGAVGRQVVQMAARMSGTRLRLGTRRPAALAALAGRLGGRAVTVGVDLADTSALAGFCRGCDVIVNCASPPGRARNLVAWAALAAGAHYVDPGGDAACLAALAGRPWPGRTAAVLQAGVQPGLSALVPRWLARGGPAPPWSLTVYAGTLDKMTPGSAAEFLLSLSGADGEANALWRAGARLSGAAEPLADVTVPFFPGEIVAYPYLSAETERLARALPLDEARWYHVFQAGGRMLGVLSRLGAELRRGASLAAAAAELVRAADLEMLGREPVQQLVFQLDGWAGGQPGSRVAVLRATSTYELTATVAVIAAEQALAGLLPPGPHFAADVLDPGLADYLDGQPGVAGLHVLGSPLAAYAQADQGTL